MFSDETYDYVEIFYCNIRGSAERAGILGDFKTVNKIVVRCINLTFVSFSDKWYDTFQDKFKKIVKIL